MKGGQRPARGGLPSQRLAAFELVADVEFLVFGDPLVDLGRTGFIGPLDQLGDGRRLVFLVDDVADLPGSGRTLTIVGDGFDSVIFHGVLTFDRQASQQGIVFDVYKVVGLINVELAIAEGVTITEN